MWPLSAQSFLWDFWPIAVISLFYIIYLLLMFSLSLPLSICLWLACNPLFTNYFPSEFNNCDRLPTHSVSCGANIILLFFLFLRRIDCQERDFLIIYPMRFILSSFNANKIGNKTSREKGKKNILIASGRVITTWIWLIAGVPSCLHLPAVYCEVYLYRS